MMMQLREDLQRRDQQCAARASARHGLQPHLDGLRRAVCPHAVRTLASEASGNLCRRVAPNQACPDVPPQPGGHGCARAPPGVRRTDTIRSAPRGFAGMLMAHHAGRTPQYRGHLPFRVSRSSTRMCVEHVFGMATPESIRGLKCCTWI